MHTCPRQCLVPTCMCPCTMQNGMEPDDDDVCENAKDVKPSEVPSRELSEYVWLRGIKCSALKDRISKAQPNEVSSFPEVRCPCPCHVPCQVASCLVSAL